jgi:hypothetical protein
MKRYRDDSVKPGRGIDRNKGANFTDNAIDPWTSVPAGGNERSYSRNSGSNRGDQFIERGADSQNLLRQGEDFMFRAGTRDVFDDVVANDGGSPNGGFSGPIKYGVNRSQSDGTKRSRR